MKQSYEDGRKLVRGTDYDYYNIVEKKILDVVLSSGEKQKVRGGDEGIFNDIIHKIKNMSMEISRSVPTQWNMFMDVVLMQ